ncbi:MAG TPA: NDP-sugar synthase [Patescibacteria group bacterium]|nr:NDP-sugar synthase [Patescibacteria group bacterium]
MRALILHGGMGLRLRPLTDEFPKGFIPIRNISSVDRILCQLPDAITEAAIVVPAGDTVIANCIQGSGYPLQIRQAKPSPMESVVSYLEERDEPALVWWGDTILSLNAQKLIAHHVQSKMPATMALWETESLRELKHWGSVTLDEEGRTEGHPVPDISPIGFIKAGAFIFDASMAKAIRHIATETWNMSHILNTLLLTKQFQGYTFKGYRVNLNYGFDLLKAAQMIGVYEGISSVVDQGAMLQGRVEIGENVSIAAGAIISEGVCVVNSIILDDVIIERGATIIDSVVGPGVKIKPNTLVRRRMLTRCANKTLSQSPY